MKKQEEDTTFHKRKEIRIRKRKEKIGLGLEEDFLYSEFTKECSLKKQQQQKNYENNE